MALQIIDFVIGFMLGFLVCAIGVAKAKRDIWIAIYEEGKKKAREEMEEEV